MINNSISREKNQANTKKFIDERKNMGFKQNRVIITHFLHKAVIFVFLSNMMFVCPIKAKEPFD